MHNLVLQPGIALTLSTDLNLSYSHVEEVPRLNTNPSIFLFSLGFGPCGRWEFLCVNLRTLSFEWNGESRSHSSCSSFCESLQMKSLSKCWKEKYESFVFFPPGVPACPGRPSFLHLLDKSPGGSEQRGSINISVPVCSVRK